MERRCRLRGRNRFLEIRSQGKRWVHPFIVLGGLPNSLPFTRCGFVVSRKLGNAVTRNRVRRRLREVVRLCYQHVPAGWDLVFVARPPICRGSFAEIVIAVERLLRQAGLWQSQGDREHA